MSDIQAVTVGSIFESTPEGSYRMDRIRRANEEANAAMTPVVCGLIDRVDADIEKRMLGLGMDDAR